MKRREAVTALVVGSMVVLGLLAVFAIELSDTQAKSRQDVEARVHERSVLAGALIDSLFGSSAQTSITQGARLYGTPTVSVSLLDRNAGHNKYLALINSSGGVVAASSGFTAQARAHLTSSVTLRLLRAGHPWAMGNVLPYGAHGVINYGIALPTRSGTRYLLTGFSTAALGPFLAADLRQIPGVKGAHNYVLDARGVVIASTNPARASGYVFHTPAQLTVLHHVSGDISGHYFDQVPLPDTSWRIVLTAPDGPLFASVSGFRYWLPWLIFAAFALVCVVAPTVSWPTRSSAWSTSTGRWRPATPSSSGGRASWPVPMPSSISSPRSPRTTCRSPCARFAPSRSGSMRPKPSTCLSAGWTISAVPTPPPNACRG
jgi:hypothetical protein